MGLMDIFKKTEKEELRPSGNVDRKNLVVVGAERYENEKHMQSFSNGNITFSGSLSGYDYDSLLKDKQNHIVDLYKLADYYSDADAMVHGIIKHVYVPYSCSSDWILTGAKKKTCDLFEAQYKRMRLREKLNGIMLEYWKYGNVYIYLYNGDLITLPVHKCKIGSSSYNGTPLVDFDCTGILSEWRMKGYTCKENWIKDNNLEAYFKGFPKEVQESLNRGDQYTQLNPDNVFVFQGNKESWQRYSVPFIAACLSPLSKKELISKYEDSILNLAIRSFVHVTYGDKNKGYDVIPDRDQLVDVRKLFKQGMTGFPLVVSNQLAEAQVIQPQMSDLFQWDKYRDVNNNILSAGGVSGVIVSGVSEDGSTFASAQVSMQTAEARINAAREEFCEIMNKVNARLVEFMPNVYNLKEIPKFSFVPLDMSGKKALRETCQNLWEKGVLSTKTMMETNGYSLDLEKEQREKEDLDGTTFTMVPREQATNDSSETKEENNAGRPVMDDSERMSDPESSERGSRPKPSRPEGSGQNKF